MVKVGRTLRVKISVDGVQVECCGSLRNDYLRIAFSQDGYPWLKKKVVGTEELYFNFRLRSLTSTTVEGSKSMTVP